MNLRKLFSIVFLFAIPASSMAANVACEGCSYSQMASRALQYGKGEHRIYSLSTNAIRGFSVVCSNEVVENFDPEPKGKSAASMKSSGDLGTVQAVPGSCAFGAPLRADFMDVDAATIAAFDAVREFYVLNGNKISDVQVDYTNAGVGPFGDSVYGPLSDYQLRTNLFTHLQQSNQNVMGLIRAAAAMFGGNFNILNSTILIEVTFKDGSKFVVSFHVNERRFDVVPNSARNPNSSAIVEGNSAGYQGNYPMAGNNIEAYLNYLRSMGVTVSGSYGQRLSCSWDGVKLSCVLLMQN